jgi:hypothetical protein
MTEEGRSGWILPATGEEEEDAVVPVVDLGSIPSVERTGAMSRSSWFDREGPE